LNVNAPDPAPDPEPEPEPEPGFSGSRTSGYDDSTTAD
jgi:hypothetical protein